MYNAYKWAWRNIDKGSAFRTDASQLDITKTVGYRKPLSKKNIEMEATPTKSPGAPYVKLSKKERLRRRIEGYKKNTNSTSSQTMPRGNVVRRARFARKKAGGRRRGRKTSIRRKSMSRRSGRGRTTASLGVIAVTGGRDEEDKQVKSHLKSGIVMEVGTSASLTSASAEHGMAIVQSTCVQNQIVNAIGYALVKKLYNYAGFSVKALTDKLPAMSGGTTTEWIISYYTYGVETPLTSGALTNSSTSYADLVAAVFSQLVTISAADCNGITKWGRCILKSGIQEIAYMDLDAVHFKLDMVSNLVYQNRTVSQDATPSTFAFDSAQEPLFQVNLTGKGTGPVVVPNAGLSAYDLNVDKDTGLLPVYFGTGSSTDKYLLAEPSKKSFTNARIAWNEMCNPGVIKQSKVKSKYYCKFDKLFMELKNQGNVNQTRSMIGNFKYLWFRKTIDIVANSSPIIIGVQHHYAIGATAHYKRDNTTAGFVLAIQ